MELYVKHQQQNLINLFLKFFIPAGHGPLTTLRTVNGGVAEFATEHNHTEKANTMVKTSII
jgi:hypothetical protein